MIEVSYLLGSCLSNNRVLSEIDEHKDKLVLNIAEMYLLNMFCRSFYRILLVEIRSTMVIIDFQRTKQIQLTNQT
jgi:hypothetical protein